jgi:hypothetical protein
VNLGSLAVRVGTFIAPAILLCVLSGCIRTSEVMISNAYATMLPNGQYAVRATLTRRDIIEIVDKEIYSHLVVFDCEREEFRYPVEPTIGEIPLSSFSLAEEHVAGIHSDTIEIAGNVPGSVLRRFNRACVKMDGGSYLRREVISNVVSLHVPELDDASRQSQ